MEREELERELWRLSASDAPPDEHMDTPQWMEPILAAFDELREERDEWREKHFNDTMAAKKSGYEEGQAKAKSRLALADALADAVEKECVCDCEYCTNNPSPWTKALAAYRKGE